ncbi:sugar kinase [Sesbania bispinosa]|nr:sugar kinase [Sesbania bispinosa]
MAQKKLPVSGEKEVVGMHIDGANHEIVGTTGGSRFNALLRESEEGVAVEGDTNMEDREDNNRAVTHATCANKDTQMEDVGECNAHGK